MTNFYFNKKDYEKLIAMTSSLTIIAKSKGVISTAYDIDGEYSSVTIDEIDEFLDEIFDKAPDSDW